MDNSDSWMKHDADIHKRHIENEEVELLPPPTNVIESIHSLFIN